MRIYISDHYVIIRFRDLPELKYFIQKKVDDKDQVLFTLEDNRSIRFDAKTGVYFRGFDEAPYNISAGHTILNKSNLSDLPLENREYHGSVTGNIAEVKLEGFLVKEIFGEDKEIKTHQENYEYNVDNNLISRKKYNYMNKYNNSELSERELSEEERVDYINGKPSKRFINDGSYNKPKTIYYSYNEDGQINTIKSVEKDYTTE